MMLSSPSSSPVPSPPSLMVEVGDRPDIWVGRGMAQGLPQGATCPLPIGLAQPSLAQPSLAQPSLAQLPLAQLPLARILIVDDEPVNLRVLASHLTLAGYAIISASSGPEAIALVEDGLRPDLVILDVMMPQMTGYEVCERLRQQFAANTLPILMLTAKTQTEDRVAGLRAGANDYLSKPINRDELLARLETHLTLVRLNNACSRFVPCQFLKLLGKTSLSDIQLGDQTRRRLSILFSDIRDFTTLSETGSPEETFRFVNEYLARMEPAITAQGGFVDKFVGDGIMALFEGNMQGLAEDAIAAGIGLLRALATYNSDRQQRGEAPIKIGIGIHTGDLMLGTIGGAQRMDSTVIGDAVNLAARLQDLTKCYGVALLISHQTYHSLQYPERYAVRAIDRVQVKGRAEFIGLYEVFAADAEALQIRKRANQGLFERAIAEFHQGQITSALQGFRTCLEQVPEDTVAALYVERCLQGLG